MNNATPHSKMTARAHRKGFSPKLPADGWHEDRDGPWEAYKERCVREGAQVKNDLYGERIIWPNDSRKFHREDWPASGYLKGEKIWRGNEKLHREDGPAIEDVNGFKAWIFNNQLHRLDGPARVRTNGSVEFYKCGIRYTDITFSQRV